MYYIDINCDVGEGLGNEQELFPLISSCNIACGGHAGNEETMTFVVQLALDHGIKIGAHPSYPDTENFGRVSLHLPPEVFIASIEEQLTHFSKILERERTQLHHIKAHGALYNDLARNRILAKDYIRAIIPFMGNGKLYVPYGSVLANVALKNNIEVVYEAFADRNYNDDLSLVSRSSVNALIIEPKEVLDHIMTMVRENKVRTVSDKLIELKAETFCVHGDTPSALQILTYLADELPKQHIMIAK